jgi:hypothetical protein
MNWLQSLLGGNFVVPGLFLAGAAAMLVPIIIHLLNKRRFRTVDWAAMDFLLEADKKNRRRVRLENLLLLLLRCLAVLLIGILLARPFLQPSIAAQLFDTSQFERIVLLDDSLSMQTQLGAESAMDQAKRSLTNMIRSFSDDQSDDTLTLLLTSQPDTPLVNGVRITPESVDEIIDRIESIEPSDLKAELNEAYLELEKIISAEADNVNRVLYVVTDMRQHDWEPREGESANHPAQVLARLSRESAGCYVIDVGNEQVGNLVVTGIRAEDTIVAGGPTRFHITVANPGAEEARDVQIKLTFGESAPITADIERIAAGDSVTEAIAFTFVAPPAGADGPAGPQSAEIRAEVMSSSPERYDRLAADSIAFFPARIVPGIPTLLVDGDPSAVFGRGETFFLRRGLAPRGDVSSGFDVNVVTETEFEAEPLEKYQVIFLCNLYRLSERRLEAIEEWVSGGGGLVIMVGDQVDEDFFNQYFFAEGKGLSPARLVGLRGDETRETWAGLQIDDARHRLLTNFAGQSFALLESMQIFRWWEAAPAEDQPIAVPARFTNLSRDPAMLEKGVNKGRVLLITTPADNDWSNWADPPGYIVLMLETARYMSGNTAGRGELRVGEPIRQPLDLTLYRIDATLDKPGDEHTSVKAAPIETDSAAKTDGEEDAAPASTVWQVEYDETQKRGFYNLKLTRTDGAQEGLLFAANIDPREGDLRRADRDKLDGQFGDAPIRVIAAEEAAAQETVGSQSEIWKYVLVGLVGILLGEQVLGFLFGRRR